MGCCKSKVKTVVNEDGKEKTNFNFLGIINIMVRTLIFILTLFIVPIIVVPFSIYLMFKVIFLDNDLDFEGLIKGLGGKLKSKGKNVKEDYDLNNVELFNTNKG
jgi:hypothetical protein